MLTSSALPFEFPLEPSDLLVFFGKQISDAQVLLLLAPPFGGIALHQQTIQPKYMTQQSGVYQLIIIRGQLKSSQIIAQQQQSKSFGMDKYVEYQRMVDRNIGPLIDIDYLVRTYEDFSLTEGFFQMRTEYPYYRPVLGDGNCFYRAVAFSYLRQADLTQFKRVFHQVDNYCSSRDLYVDRTQLMNHLYRIYTKSLAPVAHTHGPSRQYALAQLFNNTPNFDTLMIMYLRSVNYREIHSHIEKYEPFINTDKPDQIENIKLLNEQAQGLEFDAMANALNIMVVTNSVTSEGFKAYDYRGRSPTIRIDLFFRPGHYDIIYDKDSIYIKQIEVKTKGITTPMYSSPQKQQDPYRSQLYQKSQFSQSPKSQIHHFRQPQSRQNQRRLSPLYDHSYGSKISNSNFYDDRNSFGTQRQRNLLQKGANPFYMQKDQKGGMHNSYNVQQNLLSSGLNTLREDKPYIKREQQINQPNKLLKTPKSTPSQQKSKIKTTPATGVWETHQDKIGEKSRVQETVIIVLFLLCTGFLYFKILS